MRNKWKIVGTVLCICLVWLVFFRDDRSKVTIKNNTGKDLVGLQLNTTFIDGSDKSEKLTLGRGERIVIPVDDDVQVIMLATFNQEGYILGDHATPIFDRYREIHSDIKIIGILEDNVLDIERR